MPVDPQLAEARLYEVVRLIRDWVERSFEPSQEERFLKNGRLRSRFDVDLGPDMQQHFELYIRASFALKNLHFRFAARQLPGAKAPRPCVEVLLDMNARTLYAEKYPAAIAKQRAPHQALEGVAEKLALNNSIPLPETPASKQKALKDGTPPAKKRKGAAREEAPTATNAEPAAAESPWAAVNPTAILPGLEGILEAKDGLAVSHAAQGPSATTRSGLVALKAQKVAVGLLKGLASADVAPTILQETLIGQTVNLWRKEEDPYISTLATTLLKTWKATWRQAEKDERNIARIGKN